MHPLMTAKDAANFLGISTRQVFKHIVDNELPYQKIGNVVCFGYPTARQLFRLNPTSKALSFQIVKGGTGKTSLALAIAVRANLYGLRVLCIDLDQQGNLTQSFGVDANQLPVMIDILAEGYSFTQAITRVYPGMDLLASRIENSLLDDVIKLKKFDLAKLYKEPINNLKQNYDLIVIDCPPNLGQSVIAATLAVDTVVAPVVLDRYSLAGLQATKQAIEELEQNYKQKINLAVTVNKYDPSAAQQRQALATLDTNLPCIHLSADFAKALAAQQSIFDDVTVCRAKREVDMLMRALLDVKKCATTAPMYEESLV